MSDEGENKVDVVENGAIVKVFLLEAALPWNTPRDVQDAAGPFWESYALTHAALGFLVEESGEKHVIEFYATNYVGSFLPSLPPPPPTPAPVTPPPTNASPTASPTSTSFSSAPVVTLAPAATRFTQQPTASLETPAKFALPLDRTDGHRGEVGDRWKDVGKPIAAVAVVSETGEGLMADLHKVAAAGNGTTDVTWDNTAAVRETSGFDPNLWVSANYVAKITGLLFNDLSGWSNKFLTAHPAYQPLSACGGSDGKGGNSFKSIGSADSYDFVWSAFERLASNGVVFEREVVLPPKRTVMCLFAKGDDADAPEYVSSKGNEEAVGYFRRTNECVTKLAAAAAAGNATYPGGGACTSRAMSHKKSASTGQGGPGSRSLYADGEAEGAVSLLLGLGGCLEGESHAFLYHNDSAFIRFPLPSSDNDTTTSAPTTNSMQSSPTFVGARKSGTIPTAGLVRYTPAMPPRPPAPPGNSDRAWIVYVAVAVVAGFFAAVAARAMLRRKQRAEMMANGERGAGRGGAGILFSSQAGAGWRSGGREASGSDFGEFDSGFGGGYGGGAMFPGDSYGSGSLGSMSGVSGQGRRGWRGSGRGGGQGASSPNNGENVELKRPLLISTESPLSGVPPSARSVSPPPGGRVAGMTTSLGRTPGSPARRAHTSDSGKTGGGGGRQFPRDSRDLSPPPFARMQGTIGAGPASSTAAGRSGGGDGTTRGRAVARNPGSGGGKDDNEAADIEVDRGPFGNDPFVGGGKTGVGREGGGASEPEGEDEVFC